MINTGTAVFRQDLLGPILQEGFGEEVYVATQVLPTILVQKRTGAIPSLLYSNDQALAIKRAPKTSFATIVSKLGQMTYDCTESGLEEFLSPEDYEILGKDYAEMMISRRLVHAVLRGRDKLLSDALFSASGESALSKNLVTASNAWSTANGTPLTDVLTSKRNILKETGVEGNALLLGYDAYINLCKNDQIRTAVRNNFGFGTSKGAAATDIEFKPEWLASLFGLKEIIIGKGTVNSANEAVTPASASRSFLWPSNYAMVFRKSSGAQDVREVGLGRTFVYDLAQTIGALAVGSLDTMRALTLEWYRREDISADVFRAREYTDMSILLPEAASLIKSI